MFDKGRDLATKLMDPNYRPNSATANRLRMQMRTGSSVVPRTPSFRGIRGRNLITLLPTLLQFMPGPIGDHVREANAKMEADREMVNQMAIDQFMQLIGRPPSTGAKTDFVNLRSQEQALNKLDKSVNQPDPIVINNQQTAATTSEDPFSRISNMGDPGFGALYPSPYN